MLTKIAWRNIWRARTRSAVVIGAIILGIWALIFMISFTTGMVQSYVDNAIATSIGHLQVHQDSFREEPKLIYSFDTTEEMLQSMSELEGVAGVAPRTLVNAMVGSSRSTRGVQIRGIDPAAEILVTALDQQIRDGEYFPEKGKNPILLSQSLAKKLKVKIRSKVVLTFQDKNNDITAGAFRVVGLFDTGNKPFDEGNVFVRRGDINRLLGADAMAHELSFFLNDPQRLSVVQEEVKAIVPELLVEDYRQVAPDLQLYEGQIQTSATIFMTIIMLALLFGIINTMLMAVLERYRELGMLMAVGMNKVRVFGMIVVETLFLALLALVPGLLLGWLTVLWLAQTGIDLSAFGGGLSQFGMSQIVYPQLQSGFYVQLALVVAFTALIGALYPAWRAIRLRPVEAIRKI